uniref:Uncharacterized protein n=1 Tax=Clastoptera arizonana TaxID=38151 RepID=A0A1B6DJY6_9HEMI
MFKNMEDHSSFVEHGFKDGVRQKSQSLQELVRFPSPELNCKTETTVSCETLNSHSVSSASKSKDSGIHRSTSCLSLASRNRSYDHVESKVKQYIKNIKDSEALRKRKEALNNKIEYVNTIKKPVIDNLEEPSILKQKIYTLESELQEKNILLETQQELYNELLYKYAEAKNIIDSMRLDGFGITYNSSQDIFKPNSDHLSNLNEKLDNRSTEINIQDAVNFKKFSTDILCESSIKHSTPLCSPKNTLSPICSVFSTSSQLNRLYIPLSKSEIIKHNNEVSNNSARKSSSIPSINKHRPTIDLPKDAPFDKVKRWQESLPNKSLLSASISDLSDSSLISFKELQLLQQSKIIANLKSEKTTKLKNQETLRKSKVNHQHLVTEYNDEDQSNVFNKKNFKCKINRSKHVSKSNLPPEKIISKDNVLTTINKDQDSKIFNNHILSNKMFDNSTAKMSTKTTLIKKRFMEDLKFKSCSDFNLRSEDEISTCYPDSESSSNITLKCSVITDDISSSSSIFENYNRFNDFVLKNSPKRKVNNTNCTPSKIAKVNGMIDARLSLKSSETNRTSECIIWESKLSNLFQKPNRKLFGTSNNIDNELWKNSCSEFKKSKNLPESLKYAEYLVNVMTRRLEMIEITLQR